MSVTTSELRIPADRRFIVVAKRATAGFAAVAGLQLEAVDDVVMALAQACEHTIDALHQTVGEACGELRIEFHMTETGLAIHMRTVCSRAELEKARLRAEAVVRERERARTQHELAVQLMGLFVDDFGYRVDNRTGGVRVRLSKHRVS